MRAWWALVRIALIAVLASASIATWMQPASAAQAGDDRDELIALGEVGEITDEYEIVVTEVVPDAAAEIAAENSFNEPAAEGHQFFLVSVAVTYIGKDEGEPTWDLNFKAVGASGVGYTTYDASCGVVPNGEYEIGSLFEGGVAEYNVCWQIDSADADSLALYVEPLLSFEDERVWFSLGNPPVEEADLSVLDDLDLVDESSRDEPIAVGAAGELDDYVITVREVVVNADDLVASENSYNDPPAEGTQFSLVRVAVTYTGSEIGSPDFDLDFQAVGDLSVGYTTFDNSCGVVPDDQMSANELFPGGTIEFNVCWAIDTADAGTLVMYVEPLFAFNDDRLWFSLDEQ